MNSPQAFISHNIANHGFSITAVPTEEGRFAYTTGFTDLGFPEVIICGLRPEIAAHFMHDIYAAYKEGRGYPLDTPIDELANLPCAFKAVTEQAAKEYCCQTLYWYEDKDKTPSFIQMVLSDRKGLLPWQKGYDADYMRAQRQLWETTH